MAVIAMLIGIAFSAIHFYNGGEFSELVPLGTLLVLFWMMDITVHVHIMASPFVAARKLMKTQKKP